MFLNRNNFFKVVIICLISFSFFLGYFLRENSAGGGKEFYELSWPIIQSFKEDFLFTIKNYGSFRDYTIPFSHFLNAYINPFSNDINNFQLSTTIISFFIFLTFAIVFKKIFQHINSTDILLISSTILLLPCFRTSAFWGKNENYGWFFLILALYFFTEIKKEISKNPESNKITNVILFCFTSACALYARQALIFLPISYLVYLFLNNVNKKIITTSIILLFLFAIPGFLLMWTWGDVYPSLPEGEAPHGGFIGGWIKPIHIFKNFPILLSFFGFYLLPILIAEFLSIGLKDFFKKYSKSFFIAFAIFIILWQINILNYLSSYTVAGGAILKLSYLIQKENFLLLLIFSSIGFSILVQFFKEDTKNNLPILLPMIIIYGFPRLLYQEYVEPLILIIFFLTINTNIKEIYFRNISTSNFILIGYFGIYLIGSIYFKHFAFPSYDEWIIFLNK